MSKRRLAARSELKASEVNALAAGAQRPPSGASPRAVSRRRAEIEQWPPRRLRPDARIPATPVASKRRFAARYFALAAARSESNAELSGSRASAAAIRASAASR